MVVCGVEEIDLVCFGFEEMMIIVYQQIWEIMMCKCKVEDLWMAFFVSVINKISSDYLLFGIFL